MFAELVGSYILMGSTNTQEPHNLPPPDELHP